MGELTCRFCGSLWWPVGTDCPSRPPPAWICGLAFPKTPGGWGGEGRPAPCFSPISDFYVLQLGILPFCKKETHPPPAAGAVAVLTLES